MDHGSAFIDEAYRRAGLATEVSGWGYTQARVDDRIVRTYLNDNTVRIVELTSNELIVSEVTLSGAMVVPTAVAAVLTVIALRS